MESLQGQALVASPYLTDPNFLRSVVYLLRHDEEGAIGLILNRPLQTTVGELLEELTEQPVQNERPVFCGGPVDGPLMLLQACDQAPVPSVYIASDQERILEICGLPGAATESQSGVYRVYDGYAGWAAGQLEDELRSGGWLVWGIPPDQLFAETDELWLTAVRQIGREILAGGIDPAKMPKDPAFN